MVLGVMLGRLVRRLGGVQAMGMRHVGMVAALMVIAFLVVFGGLAMVVRCLGVVLCSGFVVMMMLFTHDNLPQMEKRQTARAI